MTTRVPVLWLDLDGTVRQGKDDPLGKFVNGPEDVRVFPEAVTLMRRWKEGGGRIVGITNQGGVALDYMTPEAMWDTCFETDRQTGMLFDKIMVCPHHPDAKHPEMRDCWCRKPRIGMLVEAGLILAAKYDEIYPPYMGLLVGDLPSDRVCAENAGLPFMDAHDWREGA